MARKSSPPQPKLDRWEVQSAADSLIRSDEIKRNSKLLKAAKKELKTRAAAALKAAK